MSQTQGSGITKEEFDKEVLARVSTLSTKNVEKDALDFGYEAIAPALMAQSQFLGGVDWKALLKRRVQDRVEANNSWAKNDRQQKESNLPGPVDPGCDGKLDKTKYGFYIETDGRLSDHEATRAFFVDTCQVATCEDGEFILYLDAKDCFEPDCHFPFDHYFAVAEDKERNSANTCEGIRHFPYLPCPVRVYVTDKASGLQAELFDCGFGRVWLYESFADYDTGEALPFFISSEVKKDAKNGTAFFHPGNSESRILHIYNKCENLELHGDKSYGTMAIVLYKLGRDLRLRIHSNFSAKGPGDFFGERVKFR